MPQLYEFYKTHETTFTRVIECATGEALSKVRPHCFECGGHENLITILKQNTVTHSLSVTKLKMFRGCGLLYV